MENLTQDQAKEALTQGKRITHRLFTDDEFIFLDKVNEEPPLLTDEGGYPIPYFWDTRQEDVWKDGWSIYKEPNQTNNDDAVIEAVYTGASKDIEEEYDDFESAMEIRNLVNDLAQAINDLPEKFKKDNIAYVYETLEREIEKPCTK